jgi:hypothetical protein
VQLCIVPALHYEVCAAPHYVLNPLCGYGLSRLCAEPPMC